MNSKKSWHKKPESITREFNIRIYPEKEEHTCSCGCNGNCGENCHCKAKEII